MFETALREVVQAKRLSASKMTKLTDISMKSLFVRQGKFLALLFCLIVPLLPHVARHGVGVDIVQDAQRTPCVSKSL